MSDVVVKINERKANNNFIAAGTEYTSAGSTATVYREPKPQEDLPVAWTSITKKVTTAGSMNTNYIIPTKDHKTVVLIKNDEASDAKTVTFLAGQTYNSKDDYTVTVAAGAVRWVTLESAKFVNKTTGYIEVDTSETTANKVYISVLEAR